MPRKKKLGRSRNHEGTYDQLPSGKWRYAQRLGKKRPYGPARATKEDAKSAWIEKFLSPPKAKEAPVLGEWCFILIDSETGQLNDQKAGTTLSFDRTAFETTIKPHPIADKRLDEITTNDIEEWRRSLKTKPKKRRVGGSRRAPIFETVPSRPMAPTTVARYLATLRGFLSHAVHRGYIERNPCEGVKPPKQHETEKIVLRPDEQERLLRLFEDGRQRDVVILGLHGLRRGEICGLRYEDYEDGGIWVQRQALEVEGEVVIVPWTKNRKKRWVPLDEDGMTVMAKGKRGYVIPGRDGKPTWPHNVHRGLKNKLRGTEFEKVHLHDLRSSTAMSLLRTRTDVRTSAEILGHSPAVLARIYARSDRELMKESMKNRRPKSNPEDVGSTNGGTEAA